MQKFVRQPTRSFLDVYSDADHAGCKRTRKSTSGTVVMHGHHMIRSSSTTQKVISLSSGESEFYALVKASAETVGILSILKEWGIDVSHSQVWGDASAALGIVGRKGLGNVF